MDIHCAHHQLTTGFVLLNVQYSGAILLLIRKENPPATCLKARMLLKKSCWMMMLWLGQMLFVAVLDKLEGRGCLFCSKFYLYGSYLCKGNTRGTNRFVFQVRRCAPGLRCALCRCASWQVRSRVWMNYSSTGVRTTYLSMTVWLLTADWRVWKQKRASTCTIWYSSTCILVWNVVVY